MPGTAVAGATGSYPGASSDGQGGGGTVPFFYGSNLYVEKFATDTLQLTTTATEFVHNVNPGGFLRGVRLQVRSTGGVGGSATADNPWNVFQSITLENIDGAPIHYPMSGYAYYTGAWAFRPWDGDPAERFDFANGQNPSFTLFVKPEIRHTAGVLANTDARALYRIRYTLNTFANVITSGTTAPTVTVTNYLETWAQPDSADLHGNQIEPLPPGLNLSTLRRHQTFTLNAAGADNQFQLTNTGNELRGAVLIVRDSNGARQDYLSDPIRWRLDNRSLGTFSPNEVFNQMNDFYDHLQDGTSSRPTGVYVWPRFYQPGAMKGQCWLATTNATYLIWETATLSTGTNLPGTTEIITDEVVPVGAVPMELESI
jgi:hypothetical protein